ncbi:MAG: hypothetical protein ACXVH5_05890 [Ilumatobacteraceae bacterium]
MTNDNLGSNESHPITTTKSGPSPTLIGLAILIALGVAFFFQNGNTTSIHFLFFQKDAKTRWAIIVAVVIGIAIDRVFTMWWRRRGKSDNKS